MKKSAIAIYHGRTKYNLIQIGVRADGVTFRRKRITSRRSPTGFKNTKWQRKRKYIDPDDLPTSFIGDGIWFDLNRTDTRVPLPSDDQQRSRKQTKKH